MPTLDLKPCPFCGGEAFLQGPYDNEWDVLCDDDSCGASLQRTSEAAVIAAWNRRPEPTNGWILGNDTPPDSGEPVWLRTGGPITYHYEAYLLSSSREKWVTPLGYVSVHPEDHWQPLPTPPVKGT